jgi:hypothetical protein
MYAGPGGSGEEIRGNFCFFDQLTLLHGKYALGAEVLVDAMGGEYHSYSGSAEVLEHLTLVFVIQRGRCFVQQKQCDAAKDRSSEGQPLPLPPGKQDSVIPDARVETKGERCYKFTEPGSRQGIHQFSVALLRQSEEQVIAYRIIEKNDLLGHVRDAGSIHTHDPSVRLGDTGHQIQERAFAAAGDAAKHDTLSRTQTQMNVAQEGHVFLEGKTYLVKLQDKPHGRRLVHRRGGSL